MLPEGPGHRTMIMGVGNQSKMPKHFASTNVHRIANRRTMGLGYSIWSSVSFTRRTRRQIGAVPRMRHQTPMYRVIEGVARQRSLSAKKVIISAMQMQSTMVMSPCKYTIYGHDV